MVTTFKFSRFVPKYYSLPRHNLIATRPIPTFGMGLVCQLNEPGSLTNRREAIVDGAEHVADDRTK